MLQDTTGAKRKCGNGGKLHQLHLVRIIMPITLVLAAFISLLVFQANSTRRAQQQVFNTLQDATLAQARAFHLCLDGRFETLQAYASVQDAGQLGTTEMQLKSMGKTIQMTDFSRLMLVNSAGDAFTSQGADTNVRAQSFFTEVMAGQEVLEKSAGDFLDPEAHFVLAVPMWTDGRIAGAVTGTYSETVFRDIIISEVFDGAGYSVICDRDGGVITASGDHITFPQNNVFNMLQDSRFISGSLHACRSGFSDGTSGVIGISQGGVIQYAVYVPIGINDWILLNFVPSSIVDASVSGAMRSGMLLTGVIMCISLAFFIFIALSNRQEKARMDLERRKLLLSDERFRVVLAETAVIMWEYDFQSHTVYCIETPEARSSFPATMTNVPDAMIAQGYIHPDSVEAFLGMYQKLFDGMERAEGIFRVRMPGEDDWKYAHVHYKSLLDKHGRPYRAIGMFEDITEKQRAKLAYERELQVQQVMGPDILITALFDATDGKTVRKWFKDEREAVSLIDDDLKTFTKYTAERIVNTDGKPAEWQPTITLDELQRRYAVGTTEMCFEYLRRMPDGTERYVEDKSHLIIDPDSGHLMMFACLRDVDDTHRQQDALLVAVESDSMTGLLNHETALRRIESVLDTHSDGAMHALFMIDIDDFKAVNDTFGHQTGDDIIKQVAALIRGAFRESDVIGRIGGDEFIALMRNVGSVSAVRRKAQELIDALQLTCRSADRAIMLSASIGVCTAETADQTVDTLYRDADAALYESKSTGKSRYTLFSGSDVLMGEPQSIGGVASDIHLRALLDSIDGGVLIAEVRTNVLDIRIAYANRQFYNMIGIPEDLSQTSGSSILAHVFPEDRTLLEDAVLDTARNGCQLDVTYRVYTGSGTVWRHIVGSRVPAQSDGIARIITVITDITENKRAELTLAAARRQFDAPLQSALIRLANVEYEYIAFIDTRSTVITLLSTSTLARSPHVPSGGMLYEDHHSQLVETFITASERDDARISFSLNIIMNALRSIPVYTRICAVDDAETAICRKKWQFTYLDENRQTIVLTQSDVSDSFLSEVDPVTGIFNRYKVAEQIRLMLAENPDTKFALLRADIDNFKVFNDIYGVEAGDRLLKSAADYLRSLYYRIPLFLYGHIEADHFLCFLPVEALDLMPRVTELVKWFCAHNPEFAYSPRVGVYLIDDPHIDISLMVDRAFLALKSIKGKYDRPIAYYSEVMRRSLLNEQEIVSEMHSALTSGQFDIYLQPQYDYVTGEITGAEALARWQHPEKGLLLPGTFIPVFEQNGFITQLDECIWERACALLARRRCAGEPVVPISVNVSRVDIYDRGILSTLENLLQKYALPPSLLRLEITESAYMENPRQLTTVVQKLRAMGFAVEMDDFGSGYSSLNMLSDVRVDSLKLDMHFLSEINGSLRNNNILNSIIRMMRWLRLPVLAEGIETREQAEYMKSIGCVRMQGYFFGRPMPVADFERILSTARFALPEPLMRTGVEPEAVYHNASAQATELFANAPGGALLIEYCDGNIEAIRINDPFYEISGLQNKALTPWALHMQDLLRGESRLKTIAALEDAIATGAETRCTVEGTLLTNGGTIRLELSIRPLMRDAVSSTLFIGVRRA